MTIPQCCEPARLEKALLEYGVHRPNQITVRNGWNVIPVGRPSWLIPDSSVVPDGFWVAFTTDLTTDATGPQGPEDVPGYIVPGAFGIFLPMPGLWKVFYNGSTAFRALLIDVSNGAAVSVFNPGGYAVQTHTTFTVTTASTQAVAANAYDSYRFFQNNGNNDIFLRFGAAAALDTGILLTPNGGFYEMSREMGNIWRGAVNAIARTASTTMLILQGGAGPIT